jgi:hypothetical protein
MAGRLMHAVQYNSCGGEPSDLKVKFFFPSFELYNLKNLFINLFASTDHHEDYCDIYIYIYIMFLDGWMLHVYAVC